MPAHFFLPNYLPTGESTFQLSPGSPLTISGERHHYLTRVMRQRQGDTISAFDGRGHAFTATLTAVGNKEAQAQIDQVATQQARITPEVTLSLSMLKGQAMDRALQTAVEMGAADVHLVFADHTNVSLDAKRLAKKVEHWQKLMIAACEQSGQLWLPELYVHDSWGLALSHAQFTKRVSLVCSQNAPRLHTDSVPAGGANFLVGPEGGWSESELREFANRDLTSVSLGRSTLRAETMPVALLAVVDYLRA